MSKWNTPKASSKRCTVCYSPYHNRSYHTAEERLASREERQAPALERKYQPKGAN